MKSSKNFISPKSRALKPEELYGVYKTLKKYFGHQKWWPGETPFEIIIGAILTQNTAWTNVELAIINLKKKKVLTPTAMYAMPEKKLAQLIKPAGYFNVKAKRIRNFLRFLFDRYQGDLPKMFQQNTDDLRKEILSVNGIGPETADSILLYAGNHLSFVIDAYTKRIFSRHRFRLADLERKKIIHNPSKIMRIDYETWRHNFSENLPPERDLFNDFHAQIVAVGKRFCKVRKPLCSECPLGIYL